MIKKDKFKVFKTEEELFSKVDPELQQKLKWNDDTMLCFVDNLIIISGHLSSKK